MHRTSLILVVAMVLMSPMAIAQDNAVEGDGSDLRINRVLREAEKLTDTEINKVIAELGNMINTKEGLPTRQAQMDRWKRMSPDQRLDWRGKMAAAWDKQTNEEQRFQRDQVVERLAAMPGAERDMVLKALQDSIDDGTVAP